STRRRSAPLFPYTTLFRSLSSSLPRRVELSADARRESSALQPLAAPFRGRRFAGDLRRLRVDSRVRDDRAAPAGADRDGAPRTGSEEHTAELQARFELVWR